MRRILSRIRLLTPPWLIDLVWPSLEPLRPEDEQKESEKRSKILSGGLDRIEKLRDLPSNELDAILNEVRNLLDNEEERRKSAENRLTSIAGLASVAAAITLGAITRQTGISAGNGFSVFALALTNLYLVTQLIRAVFAAIRGLTRQSYLEPVAGDVLPNPEETREDYTKRKVKVLLECAHFNSHVNSTKIDQMAIAHRAVQNFLGGLLGLILVLSILSFFPSDRAPSAEQLIMRLRSDPRLIEILRGPRGLPGLQGKIGPTGAQGPQGPKGDPGPISAPSAAQPRPKSAKP